MILQMVLEIKRPSAVLWQPGFHSERQMALEMVLEMALQMQ